jgi:hypothetical protein
MGSGLLVVRGPRSLQRVQEVSQVSHPIEQYVTNLELSFRYKAYVDISDNSSTVYTPKMKFLVSSTILLSALVGTTIGRPVETDDFIPFKRESEEKADFIPFKRNGAEKADFIPFRREAESAAGD